MKNVTPLLFLASFIMVALIAVKIIDNKDKLIKAQEEALKSKRDSISTYSDELYSLDSLVQCIPDYIPKDSIMRLYWEKN